MTDTATDAKPIHPEDLRSLPIFPLRGVVLFPGAVLPLHVFEPRYLEMTRDAIAGSGLIAMTRIREPASEPSPEVYKVAGLGRIQATRELEDGRLLILLRGVARVSIDDELATDRPYRQVRATILDDAEPLSPEVSQATEAQLIRMCDQLADQIEEAEELRSLVRLADTPGERADLIAAALVQNAGDRQELLETLEVGARLDALLGLVARTMADVGVTRHLN